MLLEVDIAKLVTQWLEMLEQELVGAVQPGTVHATGTSELALLR